MTTEEKPQLANATSNLGIRINLKLDFYFKDLVKTKNVLNIEPNCM